MILCPQLIRLSAEHARWLTEIERRAPEDPASRAARLLALWDAEILPHCRVEEDVLIPELAKRLSEADATVVFTLGDHVVLRQLARELRASDGQARDTALAELERKLSEHAAFEERTLFPALQEALGCNRLAELAPEITKQERKHPVVGHRPRTKPVRKERDHDHETPHLHDEPRRRGRRAARRVARPRRREQVARHQGGRAHPQG